MATSSSWQAPWRVRAKKSPGPAAARPQVPRGRSCRGPEQHFHITLPRLTLIGLTHTADPATHGHAGDAPGGPRRRTSPMIAASNVSRMSWPLGCRDQAAVDEVVAAGDVAGPAGGQEGDQRGDLFWGSEPAGGEPKRGPTTTDLELRQAWCGLPPAGREPGRTQHAHPVSRQQFLGHTGVRDDAVEQPGLQGCRRGSGSLGAVGEQYHVGYLA
jgi:hypothetical protein